MQPCSNNAAAKGSSSSSSTQGSHPSVHHAANQAAAAKARPTAQTKPNCQPKEFCWRETSRRRKQSRRRAALHRRKSGYQVAGIFQEARQMSSAFNLVHDVIQTSKSAQNKFWKSTRSSGTILAQEEFQFELEKRSDCSASRRQRFAAQAASRSSSSLSPAEFKNKIWIFKVKFRKKGGEFIFKTCRKHGENRAEGGTLHL